MTHPALDQLKARLQELQSYAGAAAVLRWDQETYMPPRGVEARARQLATLARLIHQRFTEPVVGEWLQQLEEEALPQWDPDGDDARLVRLVRYEYDRAVKVPTEWVTAFARLTTEAREAWKDARALADFSRFQPYLERLVAMAREYAHFFEPFDHIYDPLLERFERGMKTAQVEALFAPLRERQPALLRRILEQPQVDDAFLHRYYDPERQLAFVRRMVADIGFDFARGRIDLSTHPFTTSFSVHDVRFTVRYKTDDLSEVLTGALHEMGHALYEQGIDPKFDGLPLAEGASLGVHESQSRFWENIIGRSLAFWKHFLPALRQVFPENLADVTPEAFYKAVNRVQPGFIRVEADEVTYNLHILLRFELEVALLSDDLKVADLPAAWNEKMQAYLGLTPPNDAQGVLQDIHWSQGYFGYFPTYTLGNLISAQLWNAMQTDLGDPYALVEKGDFGPILDWLREKVHRHGAKFEPQELVRRVTGSDIQAEPYLDYLEAKYSQVYGLN